MSRFRFRIFAAAGTVCGGAVRGPRARSERHTAEDILPALYSQKRFCDRVHHTHPLSPRPSTPHVGGPRMEACPAGTPTYARTRLPTTQRAPL